MLSLYIKVFEEWNCCCLYDIIIIMNAFQKLMLFPVLFRNIYIYMYFVFEDMSSRIMRCYVLWLTIEYFDIVISLGVGNKSQMKLWMPNFSLSSTIKSRKDVLVLYYSADIYNSAPLLSTASTENICLHWNINSWADAFQIHDESVSKNDNCFSNEMIKDF